MNEYPISETGVYVDSKTGQVVDSPPEEGVQLVGPGCEITPDVQRDIDAARAAAPVSIVTGGYTEPEPEPAPKASKASKAS